MKKFVYGKKEYNYLVDLQDRKTLALTISPSLSILLKAPKKIRQQEIEGFLKRKIFWIDKQLEFFRNFKFVKRQKEYVSGESFLYLGRRYMLKVQKSAENKVVLKKGKIFIFAQDCANQGLNRRLLDKWFAQRIQKIFKERLVFVLEKFDYDFVPELKTRKMSKRWGSYHSTGKIILNPLLIHGTKRQIDYVITHELCHIAHKDHGKEFYKLMKIKCPKWELEKESLERLIFNEL